MRAQIGDEVFYRKHLKPRGNSYYRYGKLQDLGVVESIGETLGNGHIKCLSTDKKKLTDDDKYNKGVMERLVFMVPQDQWPAEMVAFIADNSLQGVIGVCRESYGRDFEFVNILTLERAYVRQKSVEIQDFTFDGETFELGKPLMDEGYSVVVVGALEVELPENVEEYY